MAEALAIDKTGDVRFLKDTGIQDSLNKALASINADHGILLDLQMDDKKNYAAIAVLKINNSWSVADAVKYSPAEGFANEFIVMHSW